MSPADIIRAAMADPLLADIEVVWEPGWAGRGRPTAFKPQGCVIHHTATSRRAKGDYPSLGIVRDGRSDLPGPLSQFGLGRSGAVYVIAAGTSNHAGPGGWNGLSGNSTVWGVEAENDGIGEPWSAEALDAYPRLVAALARHTPFDPSMVSCHREWSEYKIDPTGIDGDEFRAQVSALLSGPAPSKEDQLFSPSPIRCLHLVSGHSGLLLTSGGDTHGSVVTQQPADGSLNQRWQIVGHENGEVSFVNRAGDLALDRPDYSTEAGTFLQVARTEYNAAQRWSVDELPDGRRRLWAPGTNRCLDIHMGSKDPGAALQLWYGNEQRWQGFDFAFTV